MIGAWLGTGAFIQPPCSLRSAHTMTPTSWHARFLGANQLTTAGAPALALDHGFSLHSGPISWWFPSTSRTTAVGECRQPEVRRVTRNATRPRAAPACPGPDDFGLRPQSLPTPGGKVRCSPWPSPHARSPAERRPSPPGERSGDGQPTGTDVPGRLILPAYLQRAHGLLVERHRLTKQGARPGGAAVPAHSPGCPPGQARTRGRD